MFSWKHSINISANVTHRTASAYGTPTVEDIDGTTANTVVAAGSGNRYLTVCNLGPSAVYISTNGTVTSELFQNIWPVGLNLRDFQIHDGESLSLICDTGQTSQVSVSVASEIEI